MRTDADVVVAGLGVLGAAAAGALARRGLAVIGLDRHRPPHALGSSHGGSRIIRRVYAEGELYVPPVDLAYRLWRELEAETGVRLLHVRGGLSLGGPGSRLLADALACAGEHGLDHEVLAADELTARFPGLRPPPRTTGVFDPAAGVLLAESCVEALLATARAAGAELRRDTRMDGWRATARGVRVDCGGGSLSARHLVLATGAWLAAAAPALGLELTVERQVQHWFGPSPDPAAAAGLPPFVWELSPQRTWYGLPDLGEGFKAALHHGGRRAAVETVRRAVGRGEIAAVRRLVERYLPGVGSSCRRSSVCLYTNTPDLRFLAGPLPAEPAVWLLGGGSGHAFKFAPALGELVARGIARGRAPEALEPFLPARFAGG